MSSVSGILNSVSNAACRLNASIVDISYAGRNIMRTGSRFSSRNIRGARTPTARECPLNQLFVRVVAIPIASLSVVRRKVLVISHHYNRDSITIFRTVTRPEVSHIGRTLQILSQCGFEPAGPPAELAVVCRSLIESHQASHYPISHYQFTGFRSGPTMWPCCAGPSWFTSCVKCPPYQITTS